MLVVCYYYGLSVLRMYSYCDIIRSKVKKKDVFASQGILVSFHIVLFP